MCLAPYNSGVYVNMSCVELKNVVHWSKHVENVKDVLQILLANASTATSANPHVQSALAAGSGQWGWW